MISILDLTRQYESLQPQMNETVLAVLASGRFILGPGVENFERAMAEYLGTSAAVGVASGSDALFLALKALNIGPGDEVITTPFSYIATSESISRTGATPVFVDIDPVTFNMDIALISAAITERTKALLPVHIFGQAMDMDALMAIAVEHKLFVIEDCAQAVGAEWRGKKVGSFGEYGCFSFFPSKNLGAYGDGGLVSTNSEELAKRIKTLRVHGNTGTYQHETDGINSRLDALQAAVLHVKLPHLNNWNESRRTVASRYDSLLAQLEGVTTPKVAEGVTHAFHQYTLRIPADRRDAVRQQLLDAGIQSMIYYPIPLHLQGTHRTLGYKQGDFPLCEKASAEVLSLPMFPELTEAEQQQVADALARCLQPSLAGQSA